MLAKCAGDKRQRQAPATGAHNAVDVTYLSLSTAKTAFFAVNVTDFSPSTAEKGHFHASRPLLRIDQAGGIGVCEAADAGDLIDVGAEAEAELAHELRLISRGKRVERLFLEQAAAEVRERGEDRLVPEGGKVLIVREPLTGL